MANTYKQSGVHVVFSPKHRQALLQPHFREPTQKYMTGMIKGMGHKMFEIYAMPDHVHILMAISMRMEPQRILQVLKAETTKWINDQGFLPSPFEWQSGYGWFHVSYSGIDAVANYIRHQPEHHRKQGFLPEYEQLLVENGVEYEPEYIFTDPL